MGPQGIHHQIGFTCVIKTMPRFMERYKVFWITTMEELVHQICSFEYRMVFNRQLMESLPDWSGI